MRQWDYDGKNYSSKADLKKMITSLGHNVDDEEVDFLMTILDKNFDGMVSNKELLDCFVHDENIENRFLKYWAEQGSTGDLSVYQ